MPIFNESNMLDAERLSRIARATVQNSGRLGFSADSTDLMGLAPNKRLLVSECGEKDLAVVIGDESDKRGFVIKQTGAYFYVRMKNYFDENGIDFKKTSIIYDITEMKEQFEGRPVFKLSRRDSKRDKKEEEGKDVQE